MDRVRAAARSDDQEGTLSKRDKAVEQAYEPPEIDEIDTEANPAITAAGTSQQDEIPG
jgi:hypothetical protein